MASSEHSTTETNDEGVDPPVDDVADGFVDHVVVPGRWGPAFLLVPLRHGGIGDVHVATLQETDALVVLKRIRPSMQLDVGEILDNVRRLQRRGIPGVVDVLDCGAVDGFGWVATRFVDGVDLRTLQDEARLRGQDLPPDVIAGVALGLLRSLVGLHGAGLVHRDVTANNAVVGVDGVVTLVDVDFVGPRGIAATDVVPGTVSTMSPEQAQGLPVDGRGDLLGWGIVVTELLTGEPFYGDLTTDEIWRLARVGGYRPTAFASLPAAWQALLARVLAPDPVDRFADASATRAALLQAFPSAAAVDVGAVVRELVGERLARRREAIAANRLAPRPLPPADKDAMARVRGVVELRDGYTDPFGRLGSRRDPSASVLRPRSAQTLLAIVVVVVVLMVLAAVMLWRSPPVS